MASRMINVMHQLGEHRIRDLCIHFSHVRNCFYREMRELGGGCGQFEPQSQYLLGLHLTLRITREANSQGKSSTALNII